MQAFCQDSHWRKQRDSDLAWRNGTKTYGGAIAWCEVDEKVVSGGGYCEIQAMGGAVNGFMHSSYPTNYWNGTQMIEGWYIDCYRNDWGAEIWNVPVAVCKKR